MSKCVEMSINPDLINKINKVELLNVSKLANIIVLLFTSFKISDLIGEENYVCIAITQDGWVNLSSSSVEEDTSLDHFYITIMRLVQNSQFVGHFMSSFMALFIASFLTIIDCFKRRACSICQNIFTFIFQQLI